MNVAFQPDVWGRITGLALTNRARIPKKAGAEINKEDVPKELQPCLGQYLIPMEKSEISVLFGRGRLAITIPGQGTFDLEGPDSEGMWTKTKGGDRFSFIVNDDGQVRAMVIHEIFSCPRIGP